MSKLLFTPGPTNVPEEIRRILSEDLIHHRMDDYRILLKEVNESLKLVFDTNEDVLVLTSSGTGAMESTVVNLFSTQDEVLVINTGAFGKRFVEICQVYGLVVHELTYEWGKTYELTEVQQYLEIHPQIKGIFVTFHETATGVVNDIKALGNLTKETDRLLVADCISGMVVQEFHFDSWGIDCAVASSQKGFLLPPGLSFVALSDKAKRALNQSNLPKYYWSYQKYLKSLTLNSEQPFTPAINIVVALKSALSLLLTQGLPQVIARKVVLREYVEERFTELGFKLFIAEESIRGNVLVPILVPEVVDIQMLVTTLDNRYDLTVSNGMGIYGKRMLRIGIIGEITEEDIDYLIQKIKEVLPECRKGLVE